MASTPTARRALRHPARAVVHRGRAAAGPARCGGFTLYMVTIIEIYSVKPAAGPAR